MHRRTTAPAGGGRKEAAGPCGACKFLRRKCARGCVFAPHFGSEQGAPARFAAVHKVFGASNVSKLLQVVPPPHRRDAVLTISYEAQARLSDPILGCVSTVLALHHQVVKLQAELSTVRSQLINSRLATAGALQQYSALPHQLISMQPAYSNSSVSNSITLSCFPTSEPRQPSQKNREEREESQSPADFSSENFHPN